MIPSGENFVYGGEKEFVTRKKMGCFFLTSVISYITQALEEVNLVTVIVVVAAVVEV